MLNRMLKPPKKILLAKFVLTNLYADKSHGFS